MRSDALISTLPAKMQDTANAIKRLLSLHGGRYVVKAKIWEPLELENFTREYFPRVQDLVVMAIAEAHFFRSIKSQHAEPQWPRGLQSALECLIVQSAANGSILIAASAWPHGPIAANWDLLLFYEIFRSFVGSGIDPATLTDQQWRLEAATNFGGIH